MTNAMLCCIILFATFAAGCERGNIPKNPPATNCPDAGSPAMCHRDEDCLDQPIMCTVGTLGSPFAQVLPTGECGADGKCVTETTDCTATCQPGRGCLPAEPPLTCSDGWTLCDGVCVDTAHNDNHCGQCGHRCAGGTSCQISGQCVCSNWQTLCNGECRNTDWDPLNCGACGRRCQLGEVCSNTECKATCHADYKVCGGQRQCADTDWDPDNCSWCGRKCSGKNVVVRKCTLGACEGDCVTGFLHCTGNFSVHGCEIDAMNDPNNCGACGVKCSLPKKCVKGRCQ